ncbi:hypothetical protein LSH36_40g12001 [Paralvinella palmiformis]|uniref:RRM domain-containing protein n=1 Tax=Paralvinella palmiformis TaxID=53620 RepID=A0AAD9NDI4_9ANNE|nr:hypothetical protein LSH36_40g12001 [Paralvinella palmiformis]
MSSIHQKDTTFTKIFVGGLPYHTTDQSLREFFEQFGDIEEAVVITDRQTGKSRGYGFVTMSDRVAAERACKDPNPIIDGRKANVNLAYLGAKPRIQAGAFPLALKTGIPGYLGGQIAGQPAICLRCSRSEIIPGSRLYTWITRADDPREVAFILEEQGDREAAPSVSVVISAACSGLSRFLADTVIPKSGAAPLMDVPDISLVPRYHDMSIQTYQIRDGIKRALSIWIWLAFGLPLIGKCLLLPKIPQYVYPSAYMTSPGVIPVTPQSPLSPTAAATSHLLADYTAVSPTAAAAFPTGQLPAGYEAAYPYTTTAGYATPAANYYAAAAAVAQPLGHLTAAHYQPQQIQERLQ